MGCCLQLAILIFFAVCVRLQAGHVPEPQQPAGNLSVGSLHAAESYLAFWQQLPDSLSYPSGVARML